MTLIYNIDPDKEVTPLMVRDALVSCFYSAHCEDTGLDGSEESINRSYCRQTVINMFNDIGADFDKPTKEDILHVVEKLKEFSANFRNPEIIQKHAEEIKILISRLK